MTGTRKLEMLEITTAVCLQHLRLVLHSDSFFKNPKIRTYKTFRKCGVEDKYFNLSCNGKSRITYQYYYDKIIQTKIMSNYNEYYSNSATQITCSFFFKYPFKLHKIS